MINVCLIGNSHAACDWTHYDATTPEFRDTLPGLQKTQSIYNDNPLGLTKNVPESGYRPAKEGSLTHMNEAFGMQYLKVYETWLREHGWLK